MIYSLCITTWNRDDMVIKAFEQVLNDDRIGEVVIVDDHSDWGYYQSLMFKLDRLNSKKIKLYRNESNLDCYRNKREAVGKASYEQVILLDSDNVIGVDYLDALPRVEKTVILQPSFAVPHFDFTKWENLLITKHNIQTVWSDEPMFQTMFNAMNFVVNRDEYLKVWDGSVDPVTSDSLYFNYCWLKADNKIHIIPNMSYIHNVHNESHYKKNVARTPNGFYEQILDKLKNAIWQ